MITPEDMKLIINLIEENVDPENTPAEIDTLYKKCNLFLEMADFKERTDKERDELNKRMDALLSVNKED